MPVWLNRYKYVRPRDGWPMIGRLLPLTHGDPVVDRRRPRELLGACVCGGLCLGGRGRGLFLRTRGCLRARRGSPWIGSHAPSSRRSPRKRRSVWPASTPHLTFSTDPTTAWGRHDFDGRRTQEHQALRVRSQPSFSSKRSIGRRAFRFVKPPF